MIKLKRRGAVSAPSTEQGAAPTPQDADATIETWTRRSELLRKATTAGIFACLACAPIALGVGVWNAAHPATAVASQGVMTAGVDERGRVSAYGRDAVVAWLGAAQGQEAVVQEWFPTSTLQLPVSAPKLSDPMVVSADAVAAHRWNVRVAVTVNGVREFLQVPVAYNPTTTAMGALTLPSPVPGLVRGRRLENPVSQNVPTTSDLGRTLTGFAQSFAAGQGDVTRYTSPNSPVVAISPAPFSTVTITGLSSDVPIPLDRGPHEGGTAQILVTAQATGKQTGMQTVTWTLTVRVRAGRWEVATLDSVPGVRGTTPAVVASNPSPSIPSTPK